MKFRYLLIVFLLNFFLTNFVFTKKSLAACTAVHAARDFLVNTKFVKKKFNKNTINKYLNFITSLMDFCKSLRIKMCGLLVF